MFNEKYKHNVRKLKSMLDAVHSNLCMLDITNIRERVTMFVLFEQIIQRATAHVFDCAVLRTYFYDM